MAIVKMQGIKLLLLFTFVCSSQSNTATLCGDPRVEAIVAQCCHLDRFVNSSSVTVKYYVTNNNTTGVNSWNLGIDVAWENTPKNRSTRYAVNLSPNVSPEQLLTGNLPDQLIEGICQRGIHAHKDYQPRSCSVSGDEKWIFVEEPNYSWQDLFFGFSYRLVIREYDGFVASAYSTCLSGHSYPDLFTAPGTLICLIERTVPIAFSGGQRSLEVTTDCLLMTGDEEFCSSQPILTAGAPANATIMLSYLEESLLGDVSLTILLTWDDPVQVNGNVTFYTIRVENEGKQVHFSHHLTEENSKGNSTYQFEYLVEGLPLSLEAYSIRIQPFVHLDPELFASDPTQTTFPGHATSINYFYNFLPDPTTTRSSDISAPSPGDDKDILLWIVLSGAMLLGIIVTALVFVFVLKMTHNKSSTSDVFQFKPQSRSHELIKVEDKMKLVEPDFRKVEIFDLTQIEKQEVLGSGQYGVVYKGRVRPPNENTWVEVAIKEPKQGVESWSETVNNFKNEIRLMLDLGEHPNLVAIKGCRTIDEPFMMITEFLKFGDLLTFLRKCCDPANWKLDEQYHLRPINQVQIARQVAFGMEYVTTKKYFHGDLAARNILIGKSLCVKITDFGLTDDLYQTGISNLRSGERRPYKWYDPEAIEHQYCTVKTDIWSFGVLLWEIYTFGKVTPYHGMTIQEVLRRLKDGYRLPCPSKCPSVIYKIMLACWEIEPESRPPFDEIHEALTCVIENVSPEAYCALDDEVLNKYQQAKSRRPSLTDTLRLVEEDYSEWECNKLVFESDFYSSDSFGSDIGLVGSGGKFYPMIDDQSATIDELSDNNGLEMADSGSTD